MQDPTFWVYYDTPNGRPRKSFGRDSRAAMAWAQDHADRNTAVVKEQEVWSARDDEAERTARAAEVEADNLVRAEAARDENEGPGGMYEGTRWASDYDPERGASAPEANRHPSQAGGYAVGGPMNADGTYATWGLPNR